MSNRVLPAAVRTGRRGSTLVVILVALAVTTLAATAAAALARTMQHDARGSAAALRARTAAEGAIAGVLANWPPAWSARLAPGSSETRATTSPAGSARVRVLRLDARRYLLTAEAASPALAGALGPAVRRVALFAQLDNVAYAPAAALVATGPVTLTADAELRAADAPPPGWASCGPADAAPGAAAATPSLSAAPPARVVGAVLTAPGAWQPSTPERFGDVDRAVLARRADLVLAAGGTLSPAPRAATDTSCARDASSWGEPYRGAGAVDACTADFPVVHVRGAGATELRGPARFQGMLLVDGALVVVGRVEVAGVVAVNGPLDASAGALVVDGAVLVRGASASLGAGSRVRRSRCALERASAAASRPAPLARRAWSDVVR